MESIDYAIEWALLHGINPDEHIRELLHPPIFEPYPELTEELFCQLLASAYSILQVSTREGNHGMSGS
jgi:hypothetical protein